MSLSEKLFSNFAFKFNFAPVHTGPRTPPRREVSEGRRGLGGVAVVNVGHLKNFEHLVVSCLEVYKRG
jgi:hypothetical protein